MSHDPMYMTFKCLGAFTDDVWEVQITDRVTNEWLQSKQRVMVHERELARYGDGGEWILPATVRTNGAALYQAGQTAEQASARAEWDCTSVTEAVAAAAVAQFLQMLREAMS